jgi:hypothetical protein
MPATTDEYFVLREGATQEERWSWDEISDRCRSGEFSADTQIYIADEGRWVPVGETDFGAQLGMLVAESSLLEDDDGPLAEEDDDETRAAREEMENAYAEAVYAIEGDPTALDPLIDAGSLAFEIGEAEKSRGHFQRALDLYPFHARIANEVKRRFSRSECRAFSKLERPDAPWEDLGAVITYPFQRGLLYVAAPATLFAALLFVPGGGLVVAALSLLLCYRCMWAVAEGGKEPPAWRRAFEDPVRRLALPLAAMAGVFAEWLAVFWVFARAGMLIEGKSDVGVMSYIGSSPVLTVALSVCALAYLPAAIVALEPSLRKTLDALSPWSVARTMMAMRGEYAMSLLLLFAIAVGIGIVGALTGWIPIADKLVWALATVVATLSAAFILGRLRARVSHILRSDSAS